MLLRVLKFPVRSCIYSPGCRLCHSAVFNMSKFWVRRCDGDERLQMKLTMQMASGRSKDFNFDRKREELLDSCLMRIQENISKCVYGKKKNKAKKIKAMQGAAETDCAKEQKVAVDLLQFGVPIPKDTPNNNAWVEGAALQIDGTEYTVCINSPAIKTILLPSCIMAGYPIIPRVEFEFADLNECQFTWYQELDEEKKTQKGEAASADKKTKIKGNSSWKEVGSGFTYMPTDDDISRRLRLVCVPRDTEHHTGLEYIVESKVPVTPGPGHCPFETRQQATQTRAAPGNLRVMSYNILADTYADSEYSHTTLYPYCPTYALSNDYRKQILVKEILGYNSDIICLQEVERKMFIGDLLPALDAAGFEGRQRVKTGSVPEGTAMFHRRDRFRSIGEHDLLMTEALKQDPLYVDLLEKINSKPIFSEKMFDRSSILQATVLESIDDPKKRIVMATTHLYFHPRCPHIRILQTALSFRHLQNVMSQYCVEGNPPAVIFSGDLNSWKWGGVHTFITEKYIPGTHRDWFAGGRDEFMEGMDLRHDLNLESACGYPDFTNFVGGFLGCLDYIYIDKTKLETTSVLPMPSYEEVTQFTALPSVVFPSDHIAIVCDITWKEGS